MRFGIRWSWVLFSIKSRIQTMTECLFRLRLCLWMIRDISIAREILVASEISFEAKTKHNIIDQVNKLITFHANSLHIRFFSCVLCVDPKHIFICPGRESNWTAGSEVNALTLPDFRLALSLWQSTFVVMNNRTKHSSIPTLK